MKSSNFIKDFLEGNVVLWKSFWLVGVGHSLFLFFLLPIIEKIIFSNDNIYSYVEIEQSTLQLPNFVKLSFFSRLILIISTIFVTVGIWRASENYNGSLFWIILTFIYLTFNNILPTIYLILNLFI